MSKSKVYQASNGDRDKNVYCHKYLVEFNYHGILNSTIVRGSHIYYASGPKLHRLVLQVFHNRMRYGSSVLTKTPEITIEYMGKDNTT